MNARILLVDDDAALLEALPATVALLMPDVVVESSDSAAAALELIDATDYDAVISDIKMPGMDGLTLLRELRERRPRTPTLLITGHGDRELAVEALRGGAYDFIQKPIDRDYFVASLTRAVEMRHLDRETERQRLTLERHAQVLEHVGDGVFLVDAFGTIQLWNQAAAAITGLHPARVVGRNTAVVFPAWEELRTLIPVSREPGSGEETAKAVPIELDGHEMWISVAGVEFEGDGTVYAFRSLSSERALEELRDEFVATVSHELKTPLAAIYGAAETLRARENLDESEREPLLEMIVGESSRLAQVVNDILVAGQLDQGRLRLECELVDPLELVGRLLRRMRGLTPGRELALVASPPLPRLRADPTRLTQVLENLVENAIKYSPDDTRIDLLVRADDHYVRFAVRDRGFGIPSEERRRIFSKFYRLDPQLTRGVGGTGLGLYICRELVHRMSGRISVASELGRGSTFTVDMPVAAGERVLVGVGPALGPAPSSPST